jgi:hypothetical protein
MGAIGEGGGNDAWNHRVGQVAAVRSPLPPQPPTARHCYRRFPPPPPPCCRRSQVGNVQLSQEAFHSIMTSR